MKKIISFLIFTFVFSLAIIAPVKSEASFFIAENNSNNQYLLVKFNDNTKANIVFNKLGIFDFEKINSLNLYRIKTNSQSAEKLKKNPNIQFIEKDQKLKLSYVPNDPFYNLQNYLIDSNITKAWDITRGSPNIVVAVVDTGVDYHHQDLKGKMWTNSYGHYGYDFVNKDTDPMDDHYHGTTVAGIIAAKTDNGIGIAGIANVKIMAVKSMTFTGDGFVSDIAQGIIYAADNGAKIINLSLGLPEDSAVLDDAVLYAYRKNCLIVAATGNKGINKVDNPARNPYTIGVGALNLSNTIAEYSNYGTGTSIVAVGDSIYSTGWTPTNNVNYYHYNKGTSFANAQVAGAAALLLSYDPSLSPDQIRKRILGTAKKIPVMGGKDYNPYYGYGKLDAYAALKYDKYPPSITTSIYKTRNNIFQISGEIIDDKNPSNILSETTDSNIKLVRYKIDNGNWQILNNKATNSFLLNFYTPSLTYGEHLITIEATDTAGNIKTQVLNTLNSITGAISSRPDDYKARLVSQSSYIKLSPNQTQSLTLAFQNIGKSIWTKDIVHLGTSHPNDRPSYFADNSWLNNNRIEMKENIVAPGEIAHFEFTATAPSNIKGEFKEYFNLVAENITWFDDIGLFWKISVEEPSYHAQYLGQSSFVIMNKGDTKTLWVEYRNTGTQTWNQNNVHLGTSNPLDRESIFYNPSPTSNWKSRNRIKMEKNNVAPGEIVRFTFTIQAPQTPGIYYEHFRPVADGFTWMEDIGLYWKIIVQ